MVTERSDVDASQRDFRLARATWFARVGRYAAARLALDELGGRASTDPDVLDLLARVCAQEGELDEADACWARAQEFGDDPPGARDGRRRIAAIRARGHRRTGRAAGAVAVAVCLVGSGAVGAFLASRDDGTDAALLAELRRTKAAQNDLARQVGDLRTWLDQNLLRREQMIREVRSALAESPLLLLRRDGNSLVVTFRIGLFPEAASLSAEGRQALADLARRLQRFGPDVEFTVVGHCDNIPVSSSSRYASNIDLGLDRARNAATALSVHSGLPMTTFAMTSTGAAQPPYPNTTADDRTRNRTVTIRIRPAS